MPSVECIWSAEALLGEAPFWSIDENVLYWVDIDGKKIFRFDPASGDRQVFPLNNEIGCVIPRKQGGFVAGLDDGLGFLSSDLSEIKVFAQPEADIPKTRFNDGKCDRNGRFWVASADRNEVEPLGALYCLYPSGELTCFFTDVIVGNGLGWSPDNKTMYFTDTGIGTIFAFDFDGASGSASNKRVFAKVDECHGAPDGLTIDEEGYVWSAHWAGSRITRYTPYGDVDRIIEMPVPNVTSLAFGGPDLNQLFVTTARLGMGSEELAASPLSGGLFRVEAGVRGLPETVFAG